MVLLLWILLPQKQDGEESGCNCFLWLYGALMSRDGGISFMLWLDLFFPALELEEQLKNALKKQLTCVLAFCIEPERQLV
jgi:hypothetical protein